ncbi:hypothetical protein HGRIS_012284 [Hohenbuehelia grisea]|uniref:Macro domain-containing protein n=1 Tax=Hohenbuehelia grisea TaxID=104357 RepID=A0ABR3IRT2_9AGAR
MEDIQFVLLDRSNHLVEEWKRAFAEHLPADVSSRITILNSTLENLTPPHSLFDCIVSPANSYGIMDGGFDYYLSKAISPTGDIKSAISVAQSALYKRSRGYAPPGSCTLVPLAGTACEANAHQCAFVALCPTMRVPEDVRWNREVVYNCIWSLLCEVDSYNAVVVETSEGRKIKTILLTGLGTGTGFVPAKRCAEQMALAIRHYYEALADPQEWSSIGWGKAHEDSELVRETYAEDLGLQFRRHGTQKDSASSSGCHIM